jgi:hypothetical protein
MPITMKKEGRTTDSRGMNLKGSDARPRMNISREYLMTSWNCEEQDVMI